MYRPQEAELGVGSMGVVGEVRKRPVVAQAIDAEGNWEGKWAVAVTEAAEAEAGLGSVAVVEAELGRLESQR